ncbi:ATP-binding protein [Streptosporangium roseum]|uniref:ATP-binding protein n=1 Tax=Streptosporangium roseum TaxID=2001 RepID=UPI00068D24C6|nr:ATP-binding protein [Streptosporangium roseum]
MGLHRAASLRWSALRLLAHAEFSAVPGSVATARQWARELLTGTASDATVDDLVLLLSEVVTNAVVHSDSGRAPGGSVMVCLGFGGGLVHVEVIDDGSATSVPFVRAADSDGGRGLLLVDLIATGWGACRDATGNVVWFHLPAAAPEKPGPSL